MILLVYPDFFQYDLSIFQNDWLLKKLIEKCSVAITTADKSESLMVLTKQSALALGKKRSISRALLNSIEGQVEANCDALCLPLLCSTEITSSMAVRINLIVV
jgi:hypothetical protein